MEYIWFHYAWCIAKKGMIINMKGIKNRIVFVTSGENGLGAAISKKFAEEGAKVEK